MTNFFKDIITPKSLDTTTDKLFVDWDLISYEELLDHYNVKEEATKRGEKNAPDSAAIIEDEFHNNLNVRYKKLIATRVKEISSRFEALETRADRALESMYFLDEIKKNFKNKISEYLEGFQPVITKSNSDLNSLKVEMNNFKEKHKIFRNAHYPDSRIWYYFLIIALLVVETTVNGFMFAEGSSGGQLGGMQIAFLIAAVNVIFGFLVGAYWGKLAWSIYQPYKAIGILGFIVWAIFTAIFNLCVGHIRFIYEQGLSDEINPWTQGFIHFLNSPLGLVDAMSWILVILGCLFAIIALFDGIKIDDPYPWYGSLSRKLAEAEDERQEEADNLKEEASDLCDQYLEEGDTKIKQLGSDAIELREGHDFIKERVNKEYPHYCEFYADNFKRLIGTYRNYNLEARSTKAPSYFEDEILFNWDTDNRDDQLASLSNKIEKIAKELTIRQEKWSQDRKDLEEIRIAFINEIRSYDSIS